MRTTPHFSSGSTGKNELHALGADAVPKHRFDFQSAEESWVYIFEGEH